MSYLPRFLTRRASAWAISGALLTAPAALTADEPLLRMLPDETVAAVTIADVETLREEWKRSIYAEAWASPEFKGMREAITQAWEKASERVEKDLGLSLADLYAMADGSVGMAITELDFETETPHAAILVGLDKEKRENAERVVDRALKEWMPDTAKKSANEVGGVRVFSFEFADSSSAREVPDGLRGLELETEAGTRLIQYAFTDSHFILGEGAGKPVEKVLLTMSGRDKETLGQSSKFRREEQRVKDLGLIQGYMDAGKFFGDMTRMSEAPEEGKKAFEALGIANLGGILMMFDFAPNGATTRTGLGVPANSGLLSTMLRAGEPNRLQLLEKTPSNAIAMGSWTLDVGVLWNSIRELVKQTQPQADGMLNAQLMNLRNQFGVDLERDILDHIKGEHAYYQVPLPSDLAQRLTEEQQQFMPDYSQVVILGLENGSETAKSINTLMQKLTGDPFQLPLENLDQQGFALWAMKQDPGQGMPIRPCLGVTPGGLVLSSTLEDGQAAMRRLTGASSDSLAKDEKFRAVREVLGTSDGDLRVFSYTSQKAYEGASDQMRWIVEAFSGDLIAQGISLSPDDIPPASWWRRYFLGSGQTIVQNESGFLAEYRMLAPEGQ
ncbi:MAG: hypothetical protein RLY93_15990 [Sumerlaeia bacterium]